MPTLAASGAFPPPLPTAPPVVHAWSLGAAKATSAPSGCLGSTLDTHSMVSTLHTLQNCSREISPAQGCRAALRRDSRRTAHGAFRGDSGTGASLQSAAPSSQCAQGACSWDVPCLQDRRVLTHVHSAKSEPHSWRRRQRYSCRVLLTRPRAEHSTISARPASPAFRQLENAKTGPHGEARRPCERAPAPAGALAPARN